MKGGGSRDQLHVLLSATQLERELLTWKRADDVEQQTGGEHDGAGLSDLGEQWHAQADLGVGGLQLGLRVGVGTQHDAGERLDGAARRGDAGDGLELGQEIGCTEGELHGCW